MGGQEKRDSGHQEEASAVREQEERHAGELHPAQVKARFYEGVCVSTLDL